MKWELVTHDPYPTCGASRGPRSHTRCELPPDHIVGRDTAPMHYVCHTGRSPTGRWYSWEPSDGPS
jgi:hypothetical protein